jgi:hypothetical protein
MSHRYQVQDPTGQGFPQVVDTSEWLYRWEWQWRLARIQAGPTYVVASFTRYCPDAQAHAEALRDRLNEYNYIPPLDPRGPGDILIIDNAGEFSKRPISVATVSQKWCPHAQQEVATLLEFMNRYEIHMEGTGLRFTSVTLEDK